MNVAVAHDLEEFFKIFLVLVSLLWEGWPGATQHLGGNFLPEKLVWKCSSPHQPDGILWRNIWRIHLDTEQCLGKIQKEEEV